MPDNRLLVLSATCVVLSAMFFLFPGTLVSANRLLNRTLASFDEPLIRYRYVFGVMLAVAGYCVFRLAVLLPEAAF